MKTVKPALLALFWAALISIFPARAHGQTPAPPDFSIKSIRVDPAEPYSNSDMNVYVDVANVGPARVDNVQITVNYSKLFEGQSANVSLRPGETKVLSSREYHPAPGNYEIKAKLTLGALANGLKETNETNNEKTIAVLVRDGRAPGTNADLALADVSIKEAGFAYQVEATVRNLGIDPVKCIFGVDLVTEVTKETRQVMKREDVVIPANQPFAAGAVKKMGPIPIADRDHPDSLEEGTYNVKIGVYNQAGTYVEETDRQNNYYQGTFTVAKRVAGGAIPVGVRAPKTPVGGFRAEFFTATPLEIVAGEEVRLKWSFPAAAEAALLIDSRSISLQLPAGEMTVKPSCDVKTVSFCDYTCRIVGKTKDNVKFEREVKIRVNKR